MAQPTKHIAVVNAALVTGATNANMLKQIAADPASYDADHGQMFVANIKRAVAQADANLAQLKPLAPGSAMSQVERPPGRRWDLLDPKEIFMTASHAVVTPLLPVALAVALAGALDVE